MLTKTTFGEQNVEKFLGVPVQLFCVFAQFCCFTSNKSLHLFCLQQCVALSELCNSSTLLFGRHKNIGTLCKFSVTWVVC